MGKTSKLYGNYETDALTKLERELGELIQNGNLGWEKVIIGIRNEQVDKEFLTDAILTLSEECLWYLDAKFTRDQVLDFARRVREGDLANLDRDLVEIYKYRLNGEIEVLGRVHPYRAEIFDEILYCASHHKYHLAILGVFSQVDGICRDYEEEYFFIKNQKKDFIPQVSAKVFSKFIFEPDSYFAPLRMSSTISAQEKDMADFNQLNRHRVMHGSSSDYGTEVNFFKSISLLIYLSDALMRAGFIIDPPYDSE